LETESSKTGINRTETEFLHFTSNPMKFTDNT